MRFAENGPQIPNELLCARDEGRVVFFCGAGVSRAKANLPDFFGLAKAVTDKLGVQDDSPALKVLAAAQNVSEQTGVDGLISADRVFGLLEREFSDRDIEAAVASALTPAEAVDTSAHQILVDLATTREGFVRLVTTNFDRLFDECRNGLTTFNPPRLPDPLRPTEFNGVVYLHGKATPNYDGAEGDGFVLSSAEFGRAYLSEGWATAFFHNIVSKYFVVFVGYAADDPPLQYLLEALNKTAGKLEDVYALQSGTANNADAKWRHKGVEPISYSDHAVLWETLALWAERARDPDAWHHKIIEKSKQGPEKMRPFERGQVAHIVTTTEGVRKFSEGDNPPPATWLCVFDAQLRYAKPGKLGRFGESGREVDPFNFFGLDSDIVPNKIDPDHYYENRSIPINAWDAFALNTLDRSNMRDENYCSLRGRWSANVPFLPSRIQRLGHWLVSVSHQPAAVWWAVRQISIHPRLREEISWELERDQKATPPEIKKAWRHLFEHWDNYHDSNRHDLYDLVERIKKDGWDNNLLRKFQFLTQPYLKAEKDFWGDPLPPEIVDEPNKNDLLRLDVVYPDLRIGANIPDEWLAKVLAKWRKNLQLAVELEAEIGGYELSSFCPIHPDSDPDISQFSRKHGLSGSVVFYADMFEKLLASNICAARREFAQWRSEDDPVFMRLTIWAASNPELVSNSSFGSVVDNTPNDIFWGSYHTRDLLLTLASRWNELSTNTQKAIERRIRKGPDRWNNEEEKDYTERSAAAVLKYINWMHSQGCKFSFDIETVNKELIEDAPGWKADYADGAARSLEPRGGMVRTDSEYSALLVEPLSTTLEKARELSGRQGHDFVESDPFAGLSKNRPVRAFATLRSTAKRGEYPEWAWRTFLDSEQRKDDNPKFIAFVAEQIVRIADSDVASFIRPAANWCRKIADKLVEFDPSLFSKLTERLTASLKLKPERGFSGVVRGNKEADWVMEAINSPTGDVAMAIFTDPQVSNLGVGATFPGSWARQVEALLALPGDLRQHTLVIFAHRLSWFFAIDPSWTRNHLLSILDAGDTNDRQALWSGFLWGGRVEGYELFSLLKPHLITLATSHKLEKRGHTTAVSGLLLTAWRLKNRKTGERWVSDDELRDVLLKSSDDLRLNILWRAEQLSKSEEDEINASDQSVLLDLLRDVWPRQVAARTPSVSACLCELVFSQPEFFPELFEVVLPLLGKIGRNHLNLYKLQKNKYELVKAHPEKILSLLYAVLPDEIASWPYDIGELLGQIGAANTDLNTDARLIELRRHWNSR